ncbi:MAG: hypothetical protein L0271_03610, partial [Gemmatimonadetes bacterium]|nr:hypothetical protein [Gemmatimonadota bacterium]
AMQEAGFREDAFDAANVGVVVGTEFGGDFHFELQIGWRINAIKRILEQQLAAHYIEPARVREIVAAFADALLEKWPALVDEGCCFQHSTLASRIARTWDLGGGAATIDGGRASFPAAVSLAVNLLRAGDCDAVVCGAGLRRSRYGQSQLRSPSASAASVARAGAGFDSQDGAEQSLAAFTLGNELSDGAGALVLKRLADARRDGDRIYGIVRSVECGNDAIEPASLDALAKSSAERDPPPIKTVEQRLGALGIASFLLATRHLEAWDGSAPDAARVLLRTASRGQNYRVLLEAGTNHAPPDCATRAPVMLTTPRSQPRTRLSVLRAVDAPFGDDAAAAHFIGKALVLGANPAADALCAKLQALDVKVAQCPLDDPAGVCSVLETMWEEGPVPHLFVMSPLDAPHELADDAARFAWMKQTQLAGVFHICRRWSQLMQAGDAIGGGTAVVVTALGGDFGHSGSCAPEHGGGLPELFFSLHAESAGRILTRAIDTGPREPPEMIARETFSELAHPAADVAVAYVHGHRRVLRAVGYAPAQWQPRSLASGAVWLFIAEPLGALA